MNDFPEPDVPTGAIVTAASLLEMLNGTDEPIAAEIYGSLDKAVEEWGMDELTRAYGLLICCFLTMAAPPEDGPDALHVVVPAVLTKLCRLETLSPQVIPILAGALTTAFLNGDPYEWRRDYGPIPRSETLGWCYTAWMLADFIDHCSGQPGIAIKLVYDVILRDADT